ncbi:MAG: hypothetical protein H6R07_60 [Proteobacteria bacterium]|nr:hypothetical protein [Pseudomonadota bacterium]
MPICRRRQAGDVMPAASDIALLSAKTINARWQPAFGDYCLAGAGADDDTALMQGRMALFRIRPGFYLYSADWIHLQDMTCQALLPPGIRIMLRLQGCAELTLDGVRLLPDAAGCAGAVCALTAPASLVRRARAQTCERLLGLVLMPAWLEEAGLLRAGSQTGWAWHPACRSWQPSARTATLANQLLRYGGEPCPLQQLQIESKALELVTEALDFLDLDQTGTAGLRPDEFRRVSRLKAFLDSGEADRLDLPAIAQYAGCNANTLQQWFRQAYGQTIFDYLRESRLRRAARLLEQDGISVAQAAEVAGYTSQGNFSTAFRRCFGICPKQLRCKV